MLGKKDIFKLLKENLDKDEQINEDLEMYINYLLEKDIFEGDECDKIIQAFETLKVLSEKDLLNDE